MELQLQQKRDLRRHLEIDKEFRQAQQVKGFQTEPEGFDEDLDTELPLRYTDSYKFLALNGRGYFITSSERFEVVD